MRAARDLHALVLSPVFPAGGASAARPVLGIEEFADPAAMDQKFFWLVTVHLTFVASGVLMAAMDWLVSRSDKH